MSKEAERWERLEKLFEAALEVDGVERSRYLDEHCGDDSELAAELGEMLAAHEDSKGLAIEERLFEAPASSRRIGNYRLLEPIGRGGMGEVFLAERAGAYEQKVAIKLLRPGFHGAGMVGRFSRERQILARLEHPNIATLLDGGVTDDGRPYLVMQYVRGEPITDYCDHHRLTIEERLRLFVTACRAVQFSHANFVVHRDLKPSNILVTHEGELKLLDFGIAKLLDPELSEADATRAELRVMTPERAAPEQLLGEPVTAAVDVYGLGFLLCELLTGRVPYRFDSRDALAIARVVEEQAPRSPSALLSPRFRERDPDSEPSTQVLSERRSTQPKRLRRLLSGDLDRIVLMALRREPDRRYVSAAQLGDDVERFLAGEPIMAHGDSRSYRIRKFLGRHRISVSAAALVVLMILGFGVVTAVQSRSIAEQRDRAEAQRDLAEDVIALLTGLFETADPVKDPGREVIHVTELLERGEAMLEEVEDRPETLARMLLVLGNINYERSRSDKAEELLTRARETYRRAGLPEDVTSLEIDHRLALLVRYRGDYEAARKALSDCLTAHQRFYGSRHLKTAEVMANLSVVMPLSERGDLLEEALATRRALLDPKDPAIASSLDGLASYHRRLGDFETARRFYREALDIMIEVAGEKHPHTIIVLSNLAGVLEDPNEKIATTRRVIELREEVVPDSPDLAATWNNLGVAYLEAGYLEEARSAWRTGLELFIELLGEDHWQVGNTLHNLGRSYSLAGRYDEALDHHERALELFQQAFGDDSLRIGAQSVHRAEVLMRLGRLDEAARGAQSGVAILRRAADRPTNVLAIALTKLGRVELAVEASIKSEAALREALEVGAKVWPPEDPHHHEIRVELARALAAQDRHQEALELMQDVLPLFEGWPLANPDDVRQARAVLQTLSGDRGDD